MKNRISLEKKIEFLAKEGIIYYITNGTSDWHNYSYWLIIKKWPVDGGFYKSKSISRLISKVYKDYKNDIKPKTTIDINI